MNLQEATIKALQGKLEAKYTNKYTDPLNRYLVCLGPNTNQFWVYDEQLDVYIDIPANILDYIKQNYDDTNEITEYLYDIISKKPSWLNDEDYFYDDIEI